MAANSMDTIMLLGDSITQGGWEAGGFTQKLAYNYVRKLDVLNRGLGGYNSRWGVTIFRQIFATKEQQPHVPGVKLLVVWFGANDAVQSSNRQHVPIEEFKENLHEIINLVKSPGSDYHSPTTRIILVTPPPVYPAQRGDNERTPAVTESYGDAVVEIGKKDGVPVAHVYDAIWEKAGRKEEGLRKFLSDGLHLSADGYEVVYDTLIDVISKNYPELHYNNMPMVYISWDLVDAKNPDPSLVSHRVDV